VKDLILSSNKILILIPEDLTPDIIAAISGLSSIIKNFNDKKVKIGSSNPIPKEFTNIWEIPEIDVISEFSKKEIVLSLNRKNGVVKSVRWRENENKIQFIITPDNSKFEYDDVDLETTGDEFDLVITIGCKQLDLCGKLYFNNKSYFDNVKKVNIDIDKSNTKYGEINKIGDEQSLSDWILKIAEEDELPLTQNATESLFKGIFLSNEGFRKNKNFKKALKKFSSNQGNLTSAISQLYNTLTIAELRYIGKIISNMKIDSDGLIRSKISNNEIQGVDQNKILYPEINIISRVKDYKVAMVFSEFEKDNTVIHIYSKDKNYNIFDTYSDYSPIGNSRRITLNIRGNIDDIEQEIINKMRGTNTNNSIKKESTKPIDGDNQNKINEKKSKNSPEPLSKASSLPHPTESPMDNTYPQYNQISPIKPKSPSIPNMNPIYPSQPLPPAQ